VAGRLILARQEDRVVDEVEADLRERKVGELDLLRENDATVSVVARQHGVACGEIDAEFPDLEFLGGDVRLRGRNPVRRVSDAAGKASGTNDPHRPFLMRHRSSISRFRKIASALCLDTSTNAVRRLTHRGGNGVIRQELRSALTPCRVGSSRFGDRCH
jgi:hypothetical protein